MRNYLYSGFREIYSLKIFRNWLAAKIIKMDKHTNELNFAFEMNLCSK